MKTRYIKYKSLKYGLGGILPAIAPFAGLIPGIGGFASGLMNFAGGKMGQNNDEDLLNQRNQLNMANAGNASTMPGYQAPFAMGGQVGMADVELEKDETFLTPDKQSGQVNFPSHGQGGGDISLPAGTFVWSDTLKDDDGRTFAEASAPLLRMRAKYEKILNS